MADIKRAEQSAQKKAAGDEARRRAEIEAQATIERTTRLVEPVNDEASVVTTSVYAGFQEWPKWLYHTVNGQARIFDSLAEFEARTPAEDKANWSGDRFEGEAARDLVSPVTGGAGDPALRAAAQPARPEETDTPRLPMQAVDDREVVTLAGPALRDPQRAQAARESQPRTDRATRG